MNAAIFASVLLASRLQGTVDVFGLVVLAILMFTLMPMLRYAVWQKSMGLHTCFSLLVHFGTLVVAVLVSSTVAWAVLCVFGFVLWVCPFWFIRLGVYKNIISGPWDEAKLQPIST